MTTNVRPAPRLCGFEAQRIPRTNAYYVDAATFTIIATLLVTVDEAGIVLSYHYEAKASLRNGTEKTRLVMGPDFQRINALLDEELASTPALRRAIELERQMRAPRSSKAA